MKTIEAVQCTVCKKLHPINSDNYVKITGGIEIGNKVIVNTTTDEPLCVCVGTCFSTLVVNCKKEETIYRGFEEVFRGLGER